jgi:hypothetical protein
MGRVPAVRVVVRCMGKRASMTGSATAAGLLRVLGIRKAGNNCFEYRAYPG